MSSSLSQLPLYEIVLDELLLELSFQMHSQLSSGQLSMNELYNAELPLVGISTNTTTEYTMQNGPPKEPPNTLICHHCNRIVHPLRYAPHLDKCMGVGGRRAAARPVSYANHTNNDDVPQGHQDNYVEHMK